MKQILLVMGVFITTAAPVVLQAQDSTQQSAPASSSTVRKMVIGRVTNDKGEPLADVTVQIKGSPTATKTNNAGAYTLNVPANATLVFSFVGMGKQEIPTTGKTTVDVTMTGVTESTLDEVIVVGYGSQKKTDLTSSVATIKASEIQDLPTGNIGAALAGRLQGVNVSGGLARPGTASTVTIRNPIPSLAKDAGNPNPLVVIDDMIQIDGQGQPDFTFFNSLDPSEVESITFLKDAGAAVYGARAANGVILVKTKRGKAGVPRITYSGSYALNGEAYRTKMLTSEQYAQYYNIMNGPNGRNVTQSDQLKNAFFAPDEIEHMKNLNYDRLNDAWKSSYTTRHTIGLSGGAERATYFADLSYFKQNGNLGPLDFNRWNFRAGTDVTVASNFKVGLQVSGNNGTNTKVLSKVSGTEEERDYRSLLLAPRFIPAYIDGYPVKLPGSNNSKAVYHFDEILKLNNLSITKARNYNVNLSGEYTVPFVKGLKVRGLYARNMTGSTGSEIGTRYSIYEFTRLGTYEHIYEGATVIQPAITVSNSNRIYYTNTNSSLTQTNLVLNYNRSFGKHNISGLATIEKAEGLDETQTVMRDNPSLGTNGMLGSANGAIDGTTARYETGSLSYVARGNYSYGSKYLAEVLFRTDASTKFAPENYWGRFYSLSAGWVVSEESFFKLPWVNYLKIRYSIGKVGNDQTKAWQWRQRYTYQDGKGSVFGGNNSSTTGMKMEASPNRDATWSDELKNNLGIDARFLKNRLSATLEGYYNKATNLLVQRTGNVPVTIGGTVAAQNYGARNGYGIELSIGWSDNIGKDFNYSINGRLNWFDDKTIISDFNAIDLMRPWKEKPNMSSDIGMWGYDALGMFKTQQEADDYVKNNNITSVFGQTVNAANPLRPGMLYYRDVRGQLNADGTFGAPDGIIDENDQIQLTKKKSSHYNYGFTLKAGYKSITAECVIAGSFGGWSEIDARSKMDNSINNNFASVPEIWGNIYDPVLNPNGVMPNPYWQAISLTPASNFWKVSSFRMRMTSFNIGYVIPKKVLEQIHVSSARVFIAAMNPVTLYNPYSYKDADQAWDVYPNLRTYSLGLNISL